MNADGRSLAFGFLGLACALGASDAAEAGALRIAHSFCSIGACRDGAVPMGIVSDTSGNLFGVAQGGGIGHHGGSGTVYKLKQGKKFSILYRFADGGSLPFGPLVVDISGNLYGTTLLGGAHNKGVIFELSPGASGWQYQTLYNFCSQGGSQCSDGASSYSGLSYAGAASGALYDGVSPLYGDTQYGGNGNGVLYQLTPSGGTWTETVLHTFCTQGGSNCTDGAAPVAGILVDTGGNLLSVTTAGGANHPAGFSKGAGVAFTLAPSGNSWTETVLYNFCAQSNCSDGGIPSGGLIQDASGNLFGTAFGGGTACSVPNGGGGCGTAYKLSSDESGWHETVLHSFCSNANCADGAEPFDSLLMDGAGNLFGTTIYGGKNSSESEFGDGALFEIGSAGYKVLHSFCSQQSCVDGGSPESAVIMDKKGRLFGVTGSGGDHHEGTVFDFKP